MAKPRTLSVWTVDKQTLREIVDTSETQSEAIKRCGSNPKGTAPFRGLQARCLELGIDLSPLRQRSLSRVGRVRSSLNRSRKIPLVDILVEHSRYNRYNLKRRIIADGILEDRCSKCGCPPEWFGERLVMVLDHINGVPDDNRIANLRFLCPNCNSQTPTFSGRGLRQPGTYASRKGIRCRGCNDPIGPDTKNQLCPLCFSNGRRKVQRPSSEELSGLLVEMSMVKIGKMYGVSDNAVRKWAKSYGLL